MLMYQDNAISTKMSFEGSNQFSWSIVISEHDSVLKQYNYKIYSYIIKQSLSY